MKPAQKLAKPAISAKPAKTTKPAGFTIIEVALVLAIAGLIFLVVFLALPALQRSQRDTARRQDVGRVVASLQSYSADNGDLSGLYPSPPGMRNPGSDWHEVDGSDTSDSLYGYTGKMNQATWVIVMYGSANIGSPNAPQGCYIPASSSSYSIRAIYVSIGCSCSGNTPTPLAGYPLKSASASIRLESGGLYCASV